MPQAEADVRDLQQSLNRTLGTNLAVDGVIGMQMASAIKELEQVCGETLSDSLYASDGTYDVSAIQRIKDRVDRLVDETSVKEVQELLNAAGYDSGPEDGVPGPLTLKGVNKARTEVGLEPIDSLPDRRDQRAWLALMRELLGDPRAD